MRVWNNCLLRFVTIPRSSPPPLLPLSHALQEKASIPEHKFWKFIQLENWAAQCHIEAVEGGGEEGDFLENEHIHNLLSTWNLF